MSVALCVLPPGPPPHLADMFRTDTFCDSYPCPSGSVPTDGAPEIECSDNTCTEELCCGERRCEKNVVSPSFVIEIMRRSILYVVVVNFYLPHFLSVWPGLTSQTRHDVVCASKCSSEGRESDLRRGRCVKNVRMKVGVLPCAPHRLTHPHPPPPLRRRSF